MKALTTLLFLAVFVSLPAMAQAVEPKVGGVEGTSGVSGKKRVVESAAKPIPRLANGKPDLQGVWQARGLAWMAC